jgi:hypothetical protein
MQQQMRWPDVFHWLVKLQLHQSYLFSTLLRTPLSDPAGHTVTEACETSRSAAQLQWHGTDAALVHIRTLSLPLHMLRSEQ